MGKYLTVLAGALLVAAGLWGARAWWDAVRLFVAGTLPLVCLVIGIFAILIGAAEIWDQFATRFRSRPPGA